MKTVKLYAVSAETLWGDERDEKRAAQLSVLADLGLKETENGQVICTADEVIALIKAGYVGQYRQSESIEEVATVEAGPDVEGLFKIMADKIGTLACDSYNSKCNQHQPNVALTSVTETMLLENSCTDALQEKLAEGWRILAVQPQPDQRRPDYILGRPQMSALRG